MASCVLGGCTIFFIFPPIASGVTGFREMRSQWTDAGAVTARAAGRRASNAPSVQGMQYPVQLSVVDDKTKNSIIRVQVVSEELAQAF